MSNSDIEERRRTRETDCTNETFLLGLEESLHSSENLLVSRTPDRSSVLITESPSYEILLTDLSILSDLPSCLSSVVKLLRDELDVVSVDTVEVIGSHQFHRTLERSSNTLGRVIEIGLRASITTNLGDLSR